MIFINYNFKLCERRSDMAAVQPIPHHNSLCTIYWVMISNIEICILFTNIIKPQLFTVFSFFRTLDFSRRLRLFFAAACLGFLPSYQIISFLGKGLWKPKSYHEILGSLLTSSARSGLCSPGHRYTQWPWKRKHLISHCNTYLSSA